MTKAQGHAERSGRALCVLVVADWSAASRWLEREGLADLELRRALAPFVLVRADVTEQRDELMRQLAGFGPATAVPRFVLVDRGRVVEITDAMDTAGVVHALGNFLGQ